MITKAAILKNETIFTGKSHDIIIRNNVFGFFKRNVDGTKCEQGFVDDEGNFWNKEDAAFLAYEYGQINKEVNRLTSELLNLI